MKYGLLALSFAFFTAACARTPADHASTPRATPARTAFPTKNPIDRIVGPKLTALGIEPPSERPTHELCRRLAIDLLGRGPTPAEVKTCTSSTSAETIVDAWMRLPEHEHVERRAWGELVQYDVATTWYRYIVDADDLVGQLARGQVGYDTFAARFVIHPALYSRHPDDDWTRVIFAVFLGRTARNDEVRAMRPLVALWGERTVTDPKMQRGGGGGAAREFGFDLCGCEGSPGNCMSSAFGPRVDLRGTCEKVTPQPNRPRNADAPGFGIPAQERSLVRSASIGDEAGTLPRANGQEEQKLLSVGGALTSRPDFWEAAVDREMKRYLGWWQTGFKRPETDLPEVRAALAAGLAKDKSVRALKRTILTSVLYTMPSTVKKDDARALPAWTAGPRKLLTGEAWLDTMANAIGDSLGECDHRFIMQSYYGGGVDGDEGGYAYTNKATYVDPDLLQPRARATLEDPSHMRARFFDYESAARRLGGCGMGNVASRTSTLGFARAESDLAATLCTFGRAIVPGKGTLEEDAAALVTRFLTRPASTDESRHFADDMRVCMKPQGNEQAACTDRGVALRWLCTRIATSAEFGTY